MTISESTGKHPGQDQENTRKSRLWGGSQESSEAGQDAGCFSYLCMKNKCRGKKPVPKNLLVTMLISSNMVGTWRIGLIDHIFISKPKIH